MVQYNISKPHPAVTLDRVMEAVLANNFGLDNIGICVACGEDQDGCEPDACGYTCESCNSKAVYGAEELLIRLA